MVKETVSFKLYQCAETEESCHTPFHRVQTAVQSIEEAN